MLLNYIVTNKLFRKGVSTSVVRILGIFSTMTMSIIIGRTLGAEGTGLISLPSRIVSILSVICMIGLGQSIIRLVAISNNRRSAKDIVSAALVPVSFLTIIISSILFFLSEPIASSLLREPKFNIPFKVLSIGLFFQVIARIYSAALNGANYIWQANLVNNSLSSAITLLAIIVTLFLGIEIDIYFVVIFMVASKLFTLLVVKFSWSGALKKMKDVNNNSLQINATKLVKDSLPLYITDLIIIVLDNIFILILSIYSSPAEIGIFSICTNLMLMFTLILQVLNSTLAPSISSLYSDNRKIELQKRLRKLSGGLLAFGVILFLTILFFGKSILGIWGEEFQAGFNILILLTMGQLINISTGLSGTVLVMTGKFDIRRNIAIFSLVIGISAASYLIPNFGSLGAAYSYSLTLIFDNILKAYYSFKIIGIKTHFYV